MASVPGLSMTAELNRLTTDMPYSPTVTAGSGYMVTSAVVSIYGWYGLAYPGDVLYGVNGGTNPADYTGFGVFQVFLLGGGSDYQTISQLSSNGYVGPNVTYTCPVGGSYNSSSGMCEFPAPGATYPPMTQFKALQGAANVWAGTTGKGIIAALNYKADANRQPKDYKNLNAVCNELASTTGLSALAALRSI